MPPPDNTPPLSEKKLGDVSVWHRADVYGAVHHIQEVYTEVYLVATTMIYVGCMLTGICPLVDL